MPRYLTASQISNALGRGKSVELFLGQVEPAVIAWLELKPQADRLQLWRYDVFDQGSQDFVDVYSFEPRDGEWPDRPASTHDDLQEALVTAEETCGASCKKWVNQSVVQDEYADYLASRE